MTGQDVFHILKTATQYIKGGYMAHSERLQKIKGPIFSFSALGIKKFSWNIPNILIKQEYILKAFPESEKTRYRQARQCGGVRGRVICLGSSFSTETLLHLWEDCSFHLGHPAEFLGFLFLYWESVPNPILIFHKDAFFLNENGEKSVLGFRTEIRDDKKIPILFLEPFPQYKWKEEWNFFEVED